MNDNPHMRNVVALSHHTGLRLAEIGFLLIIFAGIWLAAAQIPQFKLATGRMIVAGIALAVAGVLLIIATHWGHFSSAGAAPDPADRRFRGNVRRRHVRLSAARRSRGCCR